ncbi:MAG TPA: class I SAM-dependent methyltransferase [Thermoanaerobaculia bacterium]|nr:class I SAM-dependent methyltransferase [Thermoanaerobaculia bacterium]
MAEHDPFSRIEYRKLIAWPERIRREWPLLEEVLSSGPRRRVLEVGCGPGQHARALAEAGFEVVAVDRSEAMLADATEEPVPEGLRFVLGDMAEVDRLALGTFGAALCIGNTLPHLTDEERLRTFAHALARVLEPGAPFLLQILGYDRIHDQRVRFLPVSFRPHEPGQTEGELVFLRLMDPLPDGRVRFYPTTLTLTPGADPPLRLERSREVLLRGWRRAEIEAALRDAGITPERALGGFDGAPFDAASSQDLVLVARRS